MEQIVPGSLQRLSAADIVRMAGLSAASLGQEYCRGGAVRRTQRQGMRLEGVVELSPPATAASDGEADVRTEALSYTVAVEIQSPTVWSSTCSCHAEGSALCAHAAALLYRWLAQPISFLVPPSSSTPVTPVQHEHIIRAEDGAQNRRTPTIKPEPPTLATHTVGGTDEILRQLGLSELRGIAREYDIATNGMNKHLLADAILASMQQTEAVRRVAATLEKPQRQLLAAITLAGGSVTDEDLRGLFERFALGHANQLQGTLLILQNKALLLRTNLNSSNQQRIGLGGALVDIGWYVPREVRAALRVTVPITPFAIEQAAQDEVQLTTTFDLLADLLLVARALNGHHLEQTQEPPARNHETFSLARMSGGLARDGSIAVPPPEDLPSTALFSSLQKAVARPPAFLRFLVRLLRLADILYRDDTGLPYFRVLPNAAELLLGPGRMEAARDLFQLWTTSSSYEELYDLSEEGLRLRCRATALHHPILRPGELDAENREARQSLLALLSQVPAGQWVSFPSFARFVYRLNPLFLQKRQHLFSTPHWWLERTEGRPLRP
ncbi:MAG: hypothetical protein J2P37_32245, partial [Ktedonobacteraceae bacterium]|nr:hypothetical protein [Ktedonobacteraceae bacterium]